MIIKRIFIDCYNYGDGKGELVNGVMWHMDYSVLTMVEVGDENISSV